MKIDDAMIMITIMEKSYDLFHWRRSVRQFPNKPENDYHCAAPQKILLRKSLFAD